MEKKKKVLISSLVFVVVAVLIGMIALVNATDTYKYVVDVVDDGSLLETISDDGDLKFKTVIDKTASSDTELVYETTVTNLIGEGKYKHVGIYIDTSYSIAQNAEFNQVKADAINVVEKLFDEVNVTSVTIATNTTCNNFTTKASAKNHINALTSNSATSITSGLGNIKNRFDSFIATYPNSEQYMIIYSDATDDVKTQLEAIEDLDSDGNPTGVPDVKIYSVLTNITSTSFGTTTNPIPDTATMYMMDTTYNNQDIIDEINTIITDVKLTYEFNDDILRSATKGNFSVQILGGTGTATQLSDSGNIEWNAGTVGAGNPVKLRFSLTIQDVGSIDRFLIYENINTIKTSAEYTPYKETTAKSFGEKNFTAPTIQICDAYDLKIKAIAERTQEVLTSDVTFDVDISRPDGTLLRKEENLAVNSDGEIIVENVKELGDVVVNIKAHVNKVEYKKNTNMSVTINNQHNSSDGSNSLTVNPEPKSINNVTGHRNIEIEVPIAEEKFKISVELADYYHDNIKLDGCEFELIIPTDNILKKDALIETTGTAGNGKLEFEVPVKGTAGEYRFILSQLNTVGTYNKVSNQSITIAFDNNGKVVNMAGQANGIKIENGENVDGKRISDSEVQIKVLNINNRLKTYGFKLNLTDGTNGIQGSKYTITSRQITSNGIMNWSRSGEMTDSNGCIYLDIPYENAGYITLFVMEDEMNSLYESITDMTSLQTSGMGKIYTFYIDNNDIIDESKPSVSSGDLKRSSSALNQIELPLVTTKKAEQNVLKIKLQNEGDGDSKLSGYTMILNNPTDATDSYTAATDADGIATFYLPAPDTGRNGWYDYNLDVDSSSLLPTQSSTGPAPLKIKFESGRITDCQNTNAGVTGNPLISLNPTISAVSSAVENTVEGTFELKVTQANVLQIELKNRVNSAPIQYGKYEIKIQNDAWPGRELKYDRTTDVNGLTNELEIPLDNYYPTILTIEQKDYDNPTIAYMKNNDKFIIEVRPDANTGGITFTPQFSSPNTVAQGVGTNKILLKDTNKPTELTDVRWELTINRFYDDGTSAGVPAGNQTLQIWPENTDYTLVDCYDSQDNQIPIVNDGGNTIVTTDATGFAKLILQPNLTTSDMWETDAYGNPTSTRKKNQRIIHIADYDINSHQIKQDENITDANGNHPDISIKIETYYELNDDVNGWNMNISDQITGSFWFKDKTIANNNAGIINGYNTFKTTASLITKNLSSNLAIDFTKYDAAKYVVGDVNNRTNAILNENDYPAGYIVTVIDTNGGTATYSCSKVQNATNTIDISGIHVQNGYYVIIQEDPNNTPAGYECDTDGEKFLVKCNNQTGEVINLERVTDNSSPEKILDGYYNSQNVGHLSSSSTYADKKIIEPVSDVAYIDLLNSEKNELKMGIKTVDKTTSEGLKDNSYHIQSYTGAQTTTDASDSKGQIDTTIGGNKKGAVGAPLKIVYTITQGVQTTSVTTNYKRVSQIDVTVYFDENGNIIQDPSSQYYYGNATVNPTISNGTWGITQVNGTNRIDIIIYKEKADPLQVSVTTKDKFSGQTINNIATYKITPSDDLQAQGASSFDVGYIQEGQSITYTLLTTIQNNSPYQNLQPQQFSLTYTTDGKVNGTLGATGINVIGSDIRVTKAGDHSINIEVDLEPALVFQIKNKEYFGTNSPIAGATFKVTNSSNNSATEITNTQGEAIIHNGEYKSAGTIETYTIHQQDSSMPEIAKIKDFQVNVTFGGNGTITSADVTLGTSDQDLKNIGLVNVTNGIITENGTTKHAVIIEINSYPAFRINITNIEKGSDNSLFPVNPIYLPNSDYKAKAKLGTTTIASVTTNPTSSSSSNPPGFTVAYLDRTEINGGIAYTIKENTTPYGYQKLESDIDIQVNFDTNGYVDISNPNSVQITNSSTSCAVVSTMTSPSSANPEEYFTINLTIKNAPEFRINIKNIDRVDSTQLSGSMWTVYQKNGNTAHETGTAQPTGYQFVPTHDETPISGSAIYVIENTQAANDYQLIHAKLEIVVTFDADGYVDLSNPPQIVPGQGYEDYIDTTVPFEIVNLTSSTDRFAINVTIKSAPKFRINVMNIDRVDSTQLSGSDWEVYVDGISSPQTYPGTAQPTGYETIITDDETPINGPATYVITNTQAATDYQLQNTPIKILVNFDSDGHVNLTTGNTPQITQGLDYIDTSIPFEINPATNSQENYTINITIKSAPKTLVNLTNVDREYGNSLAGSDWTIELDGSGCPAATVPTTNGTSASTVRVDGETPINSGTPAKYIIRNTAAAPGYQRIEQPIEIEVQFDSNGYIVANNSALTPVGSRTYCVDTANLLVILQANRVASVDYYTFDITIISTPLSSIRIKNTGRSDNAGLSNSEWQVSINGAIAVDGTPLTPAPNIVTNATAPNGYVQGVIYGETPYNGTATYTIKNIVATNNYQKLSKNIEITINFVNGEMNTITTTVKDDDTTVALYSSPISLADKLTFDIEIKTSPKIKVYIENLDRRDNTTSLVNSEFAINILDQHSQSTNATGITKPTINMVDQLLDGDTGINSTITYTISQTRGAGTPNPEFQTIDPNVIKITFNSQGEIDQACFATAVQDTYIRQKQIITIDPISTGNANLDNFAFKITIKNNPLIAINLTVESTGPSFTPISGAQVYTQSVNQTYPLRGIENVQNETSNTSGKITFLMDKAIDNSRIKYSYTEDQVSGYDKIFSTFEMETLYNDQGKIDSLPIDRTVYVTNPNDTNAIENGLFQITSYTDFSIDITIMNRELTNFKLEVNTVDYWDSVTNNNYLQQPITGKAVDNAKYIVRVLEVVDPDTKAKKNANELDTTNMPSQTITTQDIPGTNIHGYATTDFGGNATFGKTSSGTEINVAVIELEEIEKPDRYYDYSDGSLQESNYYSITEENGKQSGYTKKARISVKFDESGNIISTEVEDQYQNFKGGGGFKSPYLPKEFIELNNSNHTLSVRIKYVPSLSIAVNAVSAYGDDLDGNNLQAQYFLSTKSYSASTFTNAYTNASLNYDDITKPNTPTKFRYNTSSPGKTWTIGKYKSSGTDSQNPIYYGNTKEMLLPIEAAEKKNETNNTKQTINGYGERTFFIFEPFVTATDNSQKLTMTGGDSNQYKYQQLSAYSWERKRYVNYNGNLVAMVKAIYNSKGEIESIAAVEKVNSQGNPTGTEFGRAYGWSQPLLRTGNQGRNKDSYVEAMGGVYYPQSTSSGQTATSGTSYKGDYIDIDTTDDKHEIKVTLKYKRTTSFGNPKVVDATTGEGLPGIRINPFYTGTNNNNPVNLTADGIPKYSYTEYSNQDTKSDFISDVTGTLTNAGRPHVGILYWGGNTANGHNMYKLQSTTDTNNLFTTGIYNAYTAVEDIDLNVDYDQNGIVTNTSSITSTNSLGQANAKVVSANSLTNELNLEILVYRHYNLKLNSIDEFDGTQTTETMKYNLTTKDSSGNVIQTLNNISAYTMFSIMSNQFPGDTITYEITQANNPIEYKAIDPITLKIEYYSGNDGSGNNVNGKIAKIEWVDTATGTSQILYNQVTNTITTIPGSPINVKAVGQFETIKTSDSIDLELEIKHTPAFSMEITTRNEFYKQEKLGDVEYQIETSKGETKTVKTQSNGDSITFQMGDVYGNDTVTYVIQQNTLVSGYYAKQDIEIKVVFTSLGKIDHYTVNGNLYNIISANGQRKIVMDIYNKPKDVNLIINKYDKKTNEALDNVEFSITRQEGTTVTTVTDTTGNSDFTTNSFGHILLKIDEFEKNPTTDKDVIYTVTENAQKPSYRKIDPIEFKVHYKDDGSIGYITNISVPTCASIYQGTPGNLIEVKEKTTDDSGNLVDTVVGKASIGINIQNDNLYDILIKDEDIDNSAGTVNIQGTSYNIDIQSSENSSSSTVTTASNGIASKANNSESGDIEISINENSVGTGYRDNINNHIEFEIHKGTNQYSIELKKDLFGTQTSTGYNIISDTPDTNATYGNGIKYELQSTDGKTNVVLSIYEDTGKILVLFKNESKSEIIVKKIDAKDASVLENAKFYITSQEIDNSGNALGSVVDITDSDALYNTFETGNDGKARIDIGARPRNTIIKYTFEEIVPPTGYDRIDKFEVIATYDSSGNISISGINSARVATTGNKYDVDLIVKNGDEPKGYYVKIVSEELKNSGNKINGSEFDVIVRDDAGNIISQTSTPNQATAPTANSFGIIEQGVIRLGPITTEGNISVEVNQTGYANGYTKGNNVIYGITNVNVVFESSSPGSITTVPKFSKISYTGFSDSQVKLSDAEKQIEIHVKNEPQITFNIHKISTVKDSNNNEVPVEGAKFTITSVIDHLTYQDETDLNVESNETDPNGDVSIQVGEPKGGYDVIYKIVENKVDNYEEAEEMYLLVSYSLNGNIRDYAKISNPYSDEYLEVVDGAEGGKEISLIIKNKPEYKPIPYEIVIQTQDPQGEALINVPVELVVDEEKNGEHGKTYLAYNHISQQVAVTGGYIAETPHYTGLSGCATVTCKMTVPVQAQIQIGWQFSDNMCAEFIKDELTGVIQGSNINNTNAQVDLTEYDPLNNKYLIRIVINPTNRIEGTYGITINKTGESGNKIENNPAKFTLIQYDEVTTTSTSTTGSGTNTTGTSTTNNTTTNTTSATSTNTTATNTTSTTSTNTTTGTGTSTTGTSTATSTSTGTTYLVEFDPNTTNDVNNMPSDIYYDEDDTVAIPDNVPERAGYVFLGWDEDKTKTTDPTYALGEDVGGDNRTYKLYAIWISESDYYTGAPVYVINNEETDSLGMLQKGNIYCPGIGTYRYALLEDVTPVGYRGLLSSVPIDITFEQNPFNAEEIRVKDVKCDSDKITFAVNPNTNSITINVKNDEDISPDEYQLNMFKVDADTMTSDPILNPPTQLAEALFKVILPDTLVTGVYMESGEKQTTDIGRLEYSYIEENKENPSVRLSHMLKPTVEEVEATADGKITREYTLTEKVAPDGYALIPVDLKLELDFEVITDINGDKSVLITDARDVSSDTSYMIMFPTVSFPTDRVSYWILNTEQTSSYTVHYEGNGTVDPATGTSDVTNVPADQIKMPGTPLTLDANIPVRTGYTFLGWDPDSAATTATYSAGGQYGIDADVTLYAIWTVAKYDIIYKDNAPIDPATGLPIGLVNDMPANATKTHGIDYTIEPDMITVMTLPSIQGHTSEYSFAGWSTEPDGIDPVTGGPAGTYNPGDIYRKDTALTLYAQWNYIITYDENVPVDPAMSLPLGNVISGMPYDTNSYKQEVPVNSTTSAIIHDTSLYPDDPTMDVDYEFKEWNTKPDGTGTSYAKDSLYEDASGNPIKESVTLYAIWMYKIEYLENIPDDPSTGLPASNTVNNMPYPTALGNYVQKETASSDALVPAIANISSNILTTTPSDYDFAGWNTAPDGSGDAYSAGATYTGNQSVKLYAQWTYTIKYITNEPIDPDTGLPVGSVDSNWPADQINISTNTDATIDDQSVYAGTPTLSGYVFVGWDPDPNLDPEIKTPMYSPDTVYTDHKNITLYAIWVKDLYLKVKSGVDYRITDATINESRPSRAKVNYSTINKEEYNSGDQYLMGILPRITATYNTKNPKNVYEEGTTLEDLKDNLDTNGILRVYYVEIDPITKVESKGAELTNDSSFIGTGMYLEIESKFDTKKIELRIIVRGDVIYEDTTAQKKLTGKMLKDDSDLTVEYIENTDTKVNTRIYDSICSKLAIDVNFSGWLNNEAKQKVVDMRQKQCKYAYKDKITVTLDAGEGIIPDMKESPTNTTKIWVYEGVFYSINDNDHVVENTNYFIPRAEKTGYTFVGWRDKVTGQMITDTTIVTNTLNHELEAIYY